MNRVRLLTVLQFQSQAIHPPTKIFNQAFYIRFTRNNSNKQFKIKKIAMG